MKLILLPLMALLLPSCAWNALRNESSARANDSALYDPPAVTLIDGKTYQFKEGIITGSGQRFHSEYSYRRAVIIGEMTK